MEKHILKFIKYQMAIENVQGDICIMGIGSILFIATRFQSHLHTKHQLQICKWLQSWLAEERVAPYSNEH